MTVSSNIIIRGASEHNLKNVNLEIPRQAITVITGVSGSGKSSLVFDTILAEAQRRFFYTLSHYTRQFLDLSTRPHVHVLKGLSPAISLAQVETPPSVRATVGTLTDLSELLGVMFARFGDRHCPRHGLPTEALTDDEILRFIESKFSNKLIAICAPLVEKKKGQFRAPLTAWAEKGFLKAFVDGATVPLTPIPELEKEGKHTIKLIVDFVRVGESQKNRLMRSLKLAFTESDGYAECLVADQTGTLDLKSGAMISSKGGCATCGYSWPELDSRYFSSNSLGRCLECDGLGTLVSDEEENRVTELCKECMGTGLDVRLSAITLGAMSPLQLSLMPLQNLEVFFKTLNQRSLAKNPAFLRVIGEALSLCERINRVGLGYLHLARRVRSLSGGEAGRLKLTGILSESLRGVLFVLDEPSQGLHPNEIDKLVQNLVHLKSLGNTILVVDHDEFLIRHADLIVELGPGGGAKGGQIVAKYAPKDAPAFVRESLTAAYLEKALKLPLPERTTNVNDSWIHLRGASLHNLQLDSVKFRRPAFNVVCGVSGAGKSSLVIHTLFKNIKAQMDVQGKRKIPPLSHVQSLSGGDGFEKVELIDRRPLAKSSVSMPVTYLGVFSHIRELYAKLPDAQIRGLTARSFSVQVPGGRCEECRGRGEILLSMKFLADARVRCEVCGSKRYRDEVLDVTYKGLSIADVLDLTIEEACDHFKYQKLITRKLQPAVELGLGYLKLGQTTLSLSGGENQRLKLLPYMVGNQQAPSLLVLDEPTRGLHFADVEALLKILHKLVDDGTTIVCIEHSPDVIAHADWVVELGPGAASEGGRLVFEGDVA
ncbi:MAG: excinuclease ABC subunit UvrA, partial [Deltaproteobacteria bacterium]|nr:excinuclease ABC subunit UvrA [Deltaproteobacteria bacterium]